jgi:hypothetical protein
VQTLAQHRVLIVSSMADVSRVAAALESTLGFAVTVAPTFRAALVELRNHEHWVVVVDDSMAEGNPAIAEQLWTKFGMAVPVQINFAIASASRLAREVQAAIARRELQQLLAMRAAASQLENDLKTTVTGLLLQSQLALAEPQLNAKLTGKLEMVAELAGTLRRRLEQAQV